MIYGSHNPQSLLVKFQYLVSPKLLFYYLELFSIFPPLQCLNFALSKGVNLMQMEITMLITDDLAYQKISLSLTLSMSVSMPVVSKGTFVNTSIMSQLILFSIHKVTNNSCLGTHSSVLLQTHSMAVPNLISLDEEIIQVCSLSSFEA